MSIELPVEMIGGPLTTEFVSLIKVLSRIFETLTFRLLLNFLTVFRPFLIEFSNTLCKTPA